MLIFRAWATCGHPRDAKGRHAAHTLETAAKLKETVACEQVEKEGKVPRSTKGLFTGYYNCWPLT